MGLNETLPVCLAIDKIRPASQAEALAFLYTHGHKTPQIDPDLVSSEQQQAYVDEYRAPEMPGHETPAAVRAAAAAKAAAKAAARNTGSQLTDRTDEHAKSSRLSPAAEEIIAADVDDRDRLPEAVNVEADIDLPSLDGEESSGVEQVHEPANTVDDLDTVEASPNDAKKHWTTLL